jgi:protein-disulfide isomerase
VPVAAENRAESTDVPIPRRGRIWIVLALAIAVLALGYALVGIATQKAGRSVVHIAGIAEAQEIFGGVPQEGDRLGSSDAPVSIQVFNDLQCSSCREDFLGTIPGLVEKYARPGAVKLLYRHYSVSESPQELGFYGAEAAAQQGYGWQYTYLFFRNQDEAKRFGIDQRFLDSVAGGIEELNEPEWLEYLEDEGGTGGAISRKLDGYEELGTGLSIRTRQAAIVNGPGGTRTLQDGPSLGQIEAAIEAVQ